MFKIKGRSADLIMVTLTQKGRAEAESAEKEGRADIETVLQFIRNTSPTSVKDIAANTGISEQKARAIVKALEKAELVVVN